MFIKLGTVQVKEVLNEENFNARQASKKIVEYDPEFVYVAVRALTADKPNSNGDCFPHEELIRIDPVLQRPVYASFIGKGIYINHRSTDDPTIAKGIILDARYVTANAEDKYVELLLAVDKRRDPVFASNIERGVINKFSMGASVQFTKCSVCDNEARRKEEFCDHIAKFKMRECAAPDGSKRLAFERCYGVTYNEISAVADPADETAQILAKIATSADSDTKNSAKSNHGTVVLLNEINSRLKSVEAALMKKAANKRTAAPFPQEDPMAAPGDMGGGQPDAAPAEFAAEEPVTEGEPIVQILDAIKEFAEGRLPAQDLVETLESSGLGAPEAPGAMPPGEEAGEPTPPPADMQAPGAAYAKRESFTALVDKLAKDYAKKMNRREGAMATKTAEDSKSPKVDNQYPNYNPQGDPKQFHTKPHKSRPASDFASDAKEYAKMWNINAEFKPNADKRNAAWVISDGDRALFNVTGAGAWEDMLDDKWAEFSSREYGENLVRAIFEEGLEKTMEDVNATPAQTITPKAEVELNDKLLKAAEAKAEDLANEKTAEFKTRFLESLKVAFELQNKNVAENPLRAAAYEVLTANGHDGTLAEKIIDGEIVQAHFDVAMKEALRYSEMTPESFTEIQAHVQSLPATRVVEAQAEGKNDEELANLVAEVARQELSKKAGANVGGVRPSTSDNLVKGLDDRIRSAVRSGISKTAKVQVPVSTLRRVRGGISARA